MTEVSGVNPKQGEESPAEAAIELVGESLNLDVDRVRSQVDSVLSEPIYWLPVRHHSQIVSRFVQEAIQRRKPKIVFIEAPYDTVHLVKHITDAKTKPPVAIYSSYRDDNDVLGLAGIHTAGKHVPARFASWYPMLPYSPEYIAMQMAKQVGAEVVFIDLPHHALIASRIRTPFGGTPSGADEDGAGDSILDEEDIAGAFADEDSRDDDDDESDGKAKVDKDSSDDKAEPDQVNPGSVDVEAMVKPEKESAQPKNKPDWSEQLIAESGFYSKLAEVAGYRSWDEAWDALFEFRQFEDGTESFRREMATFCAASRATSVPARILGDGTLERERFMWKTINETLNSRNVKPEDSIVICGGFHIFLDRNDTALPPVSPEGTVYSTVVPYSYFRVSDLSGYGAANRAPRFYQTAWDLARKDRLQDLVIEHVVDVLKEARKHNEPLSSADAIAVCQHAKLLGSLRGRPMPVLDDIEDALITCCCKGDPKEVGVQLMKAMDAASIGNKVGQVTPDLGQLPLVMDFYNQLSSLDLGALMGAEKVLKLDLDKREDVANRRSIFIHRLKYLQIPIGAMPEGVTADFDTGKIFREKWVLRWSPEIESKLIEQNLYGDTVETAALSLLKEALVESESNAGGSCRQLVQAINMDLPDMVREAEDSVSRAIDSDTRFVSQTEALQCLLLIDKYAIYRSLRKGLLDDLIIRCFDRACFSLTDVISVPEDQQGSVVSALQSLAEVMLRDDTHGLDRNLFIENVKHAAGATEVEFLRGAFLGILAELRVIDAQALAKEVSLMAQAPAEVMIKAGDFLDGVIAVSQTSIMLGADNLIKAIDDLLRAADWDSFLIMIPRMRAAFERLHERQRDSLAARVAKLYGFSEKELALTELRTSAAAATQIARIDQIVAKIMKEWDFE